MTAPSRVLRCRCGCAGHLHDRDFGAGKPGCPVSELCRVWCHVMRMVYTAVPEDVFYPARNRLVAAFARWAHKQRRAVDPFVVEALADHRWGGGLQGWPRLPGGPRSAKSPTYGPAAS